MKKTLIQLFSKPKIIIPLFAILMIITGIISIGFVGKAPVIPENLTQNPVVQTVASGSTVALSFPKSGRIESILVKNGDTVKAGQVLARLSAPDAQGVISQARGALDLAQAQYVSLNAQYTTTKKQQDLLVQNAYHTLLSSGLEGVGNVQDVNVPIISGTYTCGKEGTYTLQPYASADNDTGFSFNYSGLETGVASVKFNNAVPLGKCGLQIRFTHATGFTTGTTWTITIPNTKSASYLTNKNAYDLAITTREKVLSDLATTIGNASENSVAKAQVDAAMGSYQAALGAYQSNVITAPINGVVAFVDTNAKVGQSVIANKPVVSITAQ